MLLMMMMHGVFCSRYCLQNVNLLSDSQCNNMLLEILLDNEK